VHIIKLILLTLALSPFAWGQAAMFSSTSAAVGADIYCPNGNPPTWAPTDGPSTMPLVCLSTALSSTPATGAVVNVAANNATDLQAKLTAAVCGQIITLPAGSSYSGHFTIPLLACPLNNFVWVVTGGLASLPDQNTRISPCYAGVTSLTGRPTYACPAIPGNYMAKIVTPDSALPLSFTAGSPSTTVGWRFIGLEFARTPGTGKVSELVKMEAGGVDYAIFDRCLFHGDEHQDETETAINISSASHVGIIHSYFYDFYCISSVGACTEAHPIFGGGNTANSTTETAIKIFDCFVEGASQSIFFGGGAANTTPSDIQIGMVTLFKPLQWNQLDPSWDGGLSGHAYVVKNGIELKNATRVLLEAFIIQNVWGGFSQTGPALEIDAKNQSSGALNICPVCIVTNITVRYGAINTASNIGQFTYTTNDNGVLAAAQNNISVHDLVADNLGYANCFGCSLSSNATISMYQWDIGVTSSNIYHDVSIRHVTAVDASGAVSKVGVLFLSGMLASSCCQMYNVTFTDNVMLRQTNGTFNAIGNGSVDCAFGTADGTATINACWKTYTFGGNCFIANSTTPWPGTNVTSVASQTAAFVSYNSGNGGNYALSSNACKGTATDGTDPGARFAVLNYVLAGNPAP
jgi:hypothetical protein